MLPKYDRVTGKRRKITLIDKIKVINHPNAKEDIAEFGYLTCAKCRWSTDGKEYVYVRDPKDRNEVRKTCACGMSWEVITTNAWSRRSRKHKNSDICWMWEEEIFGQENLDLP